ncbi:hypothetical protein AMS68_007042 [Peltaster fructicola]|uniref:Uncharacterized protein n=1 Tax=Peltaster fructicola TaxID=286661 RepID=A0A6H0Y3L8_9PEZI|nr:hypothetical protein AMS68_007042 [Peltaster fructicola]
MELNWFAAWIYLREKLSGYQLLGEQQAGRFDWKERSSYQRFKIPILSGGFLTLILVVWGFMAFSSESSGTVVHQVNPYVKYRLSAAWSWSNMDRLFIFGDSWSSTSFNFELQAPSPESPIGVPGWPGETTGNGPNWVGYLTYQRNESLLLTADFAVGGGTVADLGGQDARSVRSQITRYFPTFNANYPSFWASNSTLFFIWVGINDIHGDVDDAPTSSDAEISFPETFKVLNGLLDDIYAAGGRNLFFINAPPLARAPLVKMSYANQTEEWKQTVIDWNENIANSAWSFADRHNDSSVWLFDASQLLSDIMDNPCILPETCGLMRPLDYCPMFSFGRLGGIVWNSTNPECEYSADKYFWIDPLHPTTITQSAIAHGIYDALKSSER